MSNFSRKEVSPSSVLDRPLRLAPDISVSNKKSVLIIDDEEAFCSFVSLALEGTGQYEVASATKPLQGISLAKILRPDLILLDIRMPQMDGSQVAEKLLEDPNTGSIPIVFLTALVTNMETAHREMEVAGRTFIAKPVTRNELLQAIGRILA